MTGHKNFSLIGRRSFLKVMGIGTAAAPLAVKVAAEQEVANLTSLKGATSTWMREPAGLVGTYQTPGESRVGLLSQYVRTFGLPAYVDDALRRNAKHVSALDPDIAAKKSWSLNVKIQEQRHRNYMTQVDHYRNRDRWDGAAQSFKTLTGLDWYW